MTVELDTSVQYVKGVGPKRAELLARLGIRSVEDLLLSAPNHFVDLTRVVPLGEVRNAGGLVATRGRVVTSGFRSRRVREFVAVVCDEETTVELVWRNAAYMAKDRRFVEGKELLIVGAPTPRGDVRFYHPEIEEYGDLSTSLIAGALLPVYSLTRGLRQRDRRLVVRNAWEVLRHPLDDVVPAGVGLSLPPRETAFKGMHFPEKLAEAERARAALALEEAFLFFLRLFSTTRYDRRKARPLATSDGLIEQVERALGVTLTGAQRRVMAELARDLAAERPCHRLLQGDVGSGKTAVSLFASLVAVSSGAQVAVLAPTEILAEQLYGVFTSHAEAFDVPVGLLVNAMPAAQRRETLRSLADGSLPVVVGTHALLSERVKFASLGLVIVDEQHRFGVRQRALLVSKGTADGVTPHFLVQTATPIPRTLALTLYGDLDVSVLDESPPGRGEVVTRMAGEAHRKRVYEWMFKRVERGDRAFVVAPLVERSEKLSVAAAEEVYERLAKLSPVPVGLVHGKQRADERRAAMDAFRDRRVSVLVATTVIEVGVDVPEANIIVIEGAERFGLSQLHQLRGRVCRSKKTAYCVLIRSRDVPEDALRRLDGFVGTTDGFALAELDLKLRGPGDLLGERQHGVPEFRVLNPFRDVGVIARARQAAKELMERDPDLTDEENASLARYLEGTVVRAGG